MASTSFKTLIEKDVVVDDIDENDDDDQLMLMDVNFRINSVVGFGTSRIPGSKLKSAIVDAITKCKVKSIDTAKVYGNEEYLGEILEELFQSGKAKREEIFITSKVWNDDHRPEHVRAACLKSLKDLRLEYLDYYLIHWPVAWRKGTIFVSDNGVTLQDTWIAMESLVKDGLVKHIGVSNFDEIQLESIINHPKTTIQPEVNQLELHPFLAQHALVQYCKDRGVACVAWSPLGRGWRSLSRNRVIRDIANEHGKTPAQVVLRWNLQRGVGVIPKSTSLAHIKENMDVAKFRLTDDEMDAIDELDCDTRVSCDAIGCFRKSSVFAKMFGYFVYAFFWCIFLCIPNRVDLKFPVWKPKKRS